MGETRILPHNEQAEKACLGSMLIGNRCINDVFSIIDIDDFYKESHQMIAKAILELLDKKRTADTVTVSGYLKKKDELKFTGGYEYINSLIDGIPENINVFEYAGIVKEKSDIRKINLAAEKIKTATVSPNAEPDEITNQWHTEMLKITDASYKTEIPLDQFIDEKYEADLKREPGDLIGYDLKKFPKLSGAIDGVQPGFYIIGAESNIGKTTLLTNLCLDILDSNSNTRCLYFHFDDPRYRILNRFYSNLSGIELMDIDKCQGENSYFMINDKKIKAENLKRQATEKIKKYYLDRRLDLSDKNKVIEVRRMVEQSMIINPNTVIFIDGLHYLDIGDFKGIEVEEKQAEAIRRLVMDYDIPIVAAAEVRKNQLQKHQGSKITERILTLSDISGSKRLVYRSDFVLLLQPENEPDFEDSEQKEPILKGHIPKNKIGYFKGKSYRLKFEKYKARMSEVDRSFEREPEEPEGNGSYLEQS